MRRKIANPMLKLALIASGATMTAMSFLILRQDYSGIRGCLAAISYRPSSFLSRLSPLLLSVP
jgi:hypothetical protein